MIKLDPQGWGLCPHGEWQRLSASLLLRKSLVFVRNAAIGMLAVAALAGGTWAAVTQMRDKSAPQVVAPCHEPAPRGIEQPGCVVDPNGNKTN